jgi:uncharacterized protein YoxC
VPDLTEQIEKLKAQEERITKKIEKLTDDLANNKLRLREVRKRIRANERLAKKMSPAKT